MSGNTRTTSSLKAKSGPWARGWAKRRAGCFFTVVPRKVEKAGDFSVKVAQRRRPCDLLPQGKLARSIGRRGGSPAAQGFDTLSPERRPGEPRLLQLIGEILTGALQRAQRVAFDFEMTNVRLAVADLVHQGVVDQHEYRAERPALHRPLFAEVEHVGPETADPLGIALGEFEGIADAAILGLQASHQAVRQVVDGDVRLHKHQPYVDERAHFRIQVIDEW